MSFNFNITMFYYKQNVIIDIETDEIVMIISGHRRYSKITCCSDFVFRHENQGHIIYVGFEGFSSFSTSTESRASAQSLLLLTAKNL